MMAGVNRPRPVSKPLLAALSLFLFAIVFEIGLRVRFRRSTDSAIEMWKYATLLKRPVADPKLSFAHAPNARARLMGADVEINSRGLRDREYPLAKPPGTFRIVMLGDSTTFGWALPLEDTSAKILERKLNAARAVDGRRFEVINAGVGNYDTVQEVEFFETEVRAYHPDLTILVFYINDPEPVPAAKGGFLVRNSYTAAFLASRFDVALRRIGLLPAWESYYASPYDDKSPGFQACRAALESLAHSARTGGGGLLVALLPELRRINGAAYPFQSEHRKIRSLLAAQDVPAIDLIEGLKDRGPESGLWISRFDDHPNARANALVAEQLQDWLMKSPLAPRAGAVRPADGRAPDRTGLVPASRQRNGPGVGGP